MSKKKSFVLHVDSLDVLDELTNEQAGQLFKAIKAHHNDETYELEQLLKIAFTPIKNQLIRDADKYQRICEKRAEAGAKGGKQKVANASNNEQDEANLADNDNDSVNDNENVSESENKAKTSRSQFVKPTFEEVYEYILTKLESGMAARSETERFYNYYESNGWKVGKNKMKDWKAAVNGWLSRSKQYENTKRNESESIDWDSTGWSKDIRIPKQ